MATEPDDTTVAELFARDPLELSSTDLDTIIAKLRAQRARFVQGNQAAGRAPGKAKTKAAPTEKQAAALKATGDFDISDLGL